MTEKLTLNWIRHGISCNNIRKISSIVLNYWKTGDTSLFQESMLGCVYLSKNIPKPVKDVDIIFCSQLKRTIQTAILMFPQHFKEGKIKIIPGINECSLGISNKIQEPKYLIGQLESFLDLIMDNEDTKYLFTEKDKKEIPKLFSLLEHKTHFQAIKNKCEKEEKIVTEIRKYLKTKNLNKANIVSHSKYIRDYILTSLDKKVYRNYFDPQLKPFNNQIIKKVYKIKDNEIIKYHLKPLHFGCTYNSKTKTVICFYNDKTFRKSMELKHLNKSKKIKNNKIFLKKTKKSNFKKSCYQTFNQ